MHYYINGNRSGDGSCHLDYDDARAELLRLIIAKVENCSAEQLREACKKIGKVAGWHGFHEEGEVVVGSDRWSIVECTNYTCKDTAGGSGVW